jgi:hypothetical protein
MSLLANDWGYPVNPVELNPNDPLVNTGSEYMYQMATVAYHTPAQHADHRPDRERRVQGRDVPGWRV